MPGAHSLVRRCDRRANNSRNWRHQILKCDSQRLRLGSSLLARTHADPTHPGEFWLEAPIKGTILNWGFKENLTDKYVKPSEPLIRTTIRTIRAIRG